jgi:tRNA A37 threonylcarbamoyladenosine modification protein TsaB
VQDAELIAACMDAQRREVFSALYARSGVEKDRRGQARGSTTHGEFAELAEHGQHADVEETAAGLDVIEPPIVGRAEEMLGAWAGHFRGRTVCFVGDGALMCRQVLTECLKDAAQFIEPLPCLASSVALIAAERAAAGGAVGPHAIRPIYVRRPDAELARAARGLGEGGE